jgi:hypothetical protein
MVALSSGVDSSRLEGSAKLYALKARALATASVVAEIGQGNFLLILQNLRQTQMRRTMEAMTGRMMAMTVV